MAKPALRRSYGIREWDISAFLASLDKTLEIVTPVVPLIELRDERDLPILGTALAGRATHLVTGDRDLLEDGKLISWMRGRGVEIVSPAEFKL
jgi:putative PIN family toxin of toxin-antitoxin system